MSRNTFEVLTGSILLLATASAPAVNMATVLVGNPGNAGELSGEGVGGIGPDRICGAVDYSFRMGKYEVTASQYCEFLNAVAATDAYGLYNTSMSFDNPGCHIQRSGVSGSYVYRVLPMSEDWPVSCVSWGDAARFANWMHNGQPSGLQGPETTEDGSYYLNGAMTVSELLAVERQLDATWVIPTEDEWHKAAYHQNDGATGNYFDYPTGSDESPSNQLVDPDPGNNATFYDTDHTVPHYYTSVGSHENSQSPYGTFDQGGNVAEWNEGEIGAYRSWRGGSYNNYVYMLHGAIRNSGVDPLKELNGGGFRIAYVPEPGTAGLMFLAGMIIALQRHVRRNVRA